MIRSMTAYGRAKAQIGGKDITVEVKSVNNRYFDCSVKISRLYGFLEERIKSYIKERGINRGKIDIYVNIDLVDTQGVTVALDEAYAKSYIDALYRLRDLYDLKDDISVIAIDIASKVTEKEIDEKKHEALIEDFIRKMGDAS